MQDTPKNIDAEQSVIGCILVGGVATYDKVKPWLRDDEVFYTEVNKQIWASFHELKQQNTPIDTITVLEKCKDNKDNQVDAFYITGLATNIPTVANCEHYARIIWEKYIQRQTAVSANKLYNSSLENNFSDVNDILDEHSRLVDELKNIRPSLVKTIDEIIAEAKRAIKDGDNIIPFGMEVLDYPAGGMTRKEITVLGGRPGHGKTTLMVNILQSLIQQGFKVMLFNREMSNTEMIKKLCVLESKSLLYADVRKNNFESGQDNVLEMQMEKIRKKYKNLMMYDHVRTLSDTITEIQKHKPDIIIDDYIQLIQVDSVKEGRRFEIERIMQEYKWVCKNENCSALLLSQLNREMDRRINPEPRLSDYSESGVIEQTAETAMFVFYGYNFDSESYDRYESKIISAKTRYGNVGSYVLGFNGNRCKFYLNRDDAYNDSSSYKT